MSQQMKMITAKLARGPAKMGWTAWFLVDREGRALNTEPVCSTPEDKWHPWFIRVLESLTTPYWGRKESPADEPGLSQPKAKVSESPAIPEATARPWGIYDYEGQFNKYPKNVIVSATNESIAVIEGGWPQCSLAENEANAALIVTAVNEYDTNKARIARLEAALVKIMGGYGEPVSADIATAALIESPEKESE